MSTEEICLPWEIISYIIAYIPDSDRATLRSLCLVSKASYAEATRILYHTISSAQDPWSRKYPLTALLASNPKVSRLVNTYTTYGLYYTTFQPEHSPLGLTSRALPLMVNLKHLRFKNATMGMNTEVMFSNISFQLQTLHWNGDAQGLMALLKTQKELKMLHIESFVPVHGLPVYQVPECPSLISVAGNVIHLLVLLNPGNRPPNLKHVRYLPSPTDSRLLEDDQNYRRMEMAFKPVTHLILGGSVFTNVARFGDIFSSITCLEVYVIMFDVSGSIFQ